MAKANALRVAIRSFMEKRGIKPTPWAQEAGINESTFRSLLDGSAQSPRYDTLQKLADAAETTVAEMVGEKIRSPKSPRDVLPIKSLEVKASMGGGFEILKEPEGPPFYFRREWIDTVISNHPGRLRVHWFEGRSMEPTINDGDVGLIHLDYGGNEPGVYVLWDGRGIVAKRLELIPGPVNRLRIISDNPQYPPREVPAADAFVIGRVLWRGGDL